MLNLYLIISDCLFARQTAERENSTFIPICNELGLYERKQCLNEECWCVVVDVSENNKFLENFQQKK